MSKVKLARAAGQIMFITIISKILGFLRDTMTAGAFGANIESDAYMTALIIPTMLFGLFGMAISTTFIPFLSDSLKKNGKEDMFNFANSVINIIMFISIVLCALGWIFTGELVRFIAPKFDGAKFNLTVELTRLSIINILFMSLNSGYMAILQTLDDFAAPSAVGIAMDLPIIIYLLIEKNHTIMGLTIVTIIGCGAQILIQIPWLIKNRYRYSFKINFKDPRLKEMLMLILPVIMGVGINQINTFVDRVMASGLSDGSISALQYANRINSIVYSIFAAAIVTVMYPTLSKSIDKNDFTQFKKYMSKAINNINIIMIPSTVGIMILRTTIISVLFKHGAFDEKSVYMTSDALLFLSIGIGVLGIRDIYNRAFYSMQDTKTPMRNTAIGVGVNIILNILLTKHLGIKGLTLATTSSIVVCTVLLIVNLKKRIGNIEGRSLTISTLKITLASILMGIGVYFTNRYFINNFIGFRGDFLALAVSIVLGVIIYAILLNIFKVEEYAVLKRALINRIKRKVS